LYLKSFLNLKLDNIFNFLPVFLRLNSTLRDDIFHLMLSTGDFQRRCRLQRMCLLLLELLHHVKQRLSEILSLPCQRLLLAYFLIVSQKRSAISHSNEDGYRCRLDPIGRSHTLDSDLQGRQFLLELSDESFV